MDRPLQPRYVCGSGATLASSHVLLVLLLVLTDDVDACLFGSRLQADAATMRALLPGFRSQRGRLRTGGQDHSGDMPTSFVLLTGGQTGPASSDFLIDVWMMTADAEGTYWTGLQPLTAGRYDAVPVSRCCCSRAQQ